MNAWPSSFNELYGMRQEYADALVELCDRHGWKVHYTQRQRCLLSLKTPGHSCTKDMRFCVPESGKWSDLDHTVILSRSGGGELAILSQNYGRIEKWEPWYVGPAPYGNGTHAYLLFGPGPSEGGESRAARRAREVADLTAWALANLKARPDLEHTQHSQKVEMPSSESRSERLARPDQTTVYRAYNATGELLYVGIAKHWPDRWVNHRSRASFFDDVATLRLETYPTRRDALDAERAAIQTENPKHNVRHNGEKSNPATSTLSTSTSVVANIINDHTADGVTLSPADIQRLAKNRHQELSESTIRRSLRELTEKGTAQMTGSLMRPRYSAHVLRGASASLATDVAPAETSPVRVRECVALGIMHPDGRLECPVGRVTSVSNEWVELALMSFLTGRFTCGLSRYRIADIQEVRIANSERIDNETVFDTDPLAAFQLEWKMKN